VSDFIAALGLVLVLEGVFYGGMPALAKRLAAELISLPEQAMRLGGVFAIALGVLLVWFVRG